MGLCLGPYGGPRGVAVSYERGRWRADDAFVAPGHSHDQSTLDAVYVYVDAVYVYVVPWSEFPILHIRICSIMVGAPLVFVAPGDLHIRVQHRE